MSVTRIKAMGADLSKEPSYVASVELPTITFDRVAFLQTQKAHHIGDSAAWFDELRIADNLEDLIKTNRNP